MQSQGEPMITQAEKLTDEEKKVAYVMGYDVDGVTLVEKLIMRWHAFVALRRIQSNKIPLRVFLRSVSDHDEVES